jgi:hypothetical protein
MAAQRKAWNLRNEEWEASKSSSVQAAESSRRSRH